MKQKYREYSHALCEWAVLDCFSGKWMRNDVSATVEEYAGIDRRRIRAENMEGIQWGKIEAAESIACEMENRIEATVNAYQRGDTDYWTYLELEPVLFRERKDGMNGKIRVIAYECIFHQLFNHLVFLMLEPLFMAKLLPTQYASIPKRGQTGLKDKLHGELERPDIKIRHGQKTDVRKAYPSTKYSKIIEHIEQEIPSAKVAIILLKAISHMSPNGSLIIGGYIDAWLFNFAMSYILRYVMSLTKERRGKKKRLIQLTVSFMDDFLLAGSREADVGTALRKMIVFAKKEFAIDIKVGKATHYLTHEEERAKRKAKSPARRGAPSVDMGGYRVYSNHVTVRKKIFLRLRRQYLRAAQSIRKTGTILLCRAYKIVSYWGYLKNTNSQKFRNKYEAESIFNIAKSIVAYHAREKARKERLIYNEIQHRIYNSTVICRS